MWHLDPQIHLAVHGVIAESEAGVAREPRPRVPAADVDKEGSNDGRVPHAASRERRLVGTVLVEAVGKADRAAQVVSGRPLVGSAARSRARKGLEGVPAMLPARLVRTVGKRQRLRKEVSRQWPDSLGGVQLDLLATPLALQPDDLVALPPERLSPLDMVAAAGVLVQEAEVPAHRVVAHGPANLDVAELGETGGAKGVRDE